MALTPAIFRYSVFFFALIPLFAVWGFWVTYFTRPVETLVRLDHVHGIAMFGWCLMLIVQAALIRSHRRPIHRTVGRLSYVLAPLIVISTIMLANFRLDARGLTPQALYFLALQIFMLLQFAVFYVQAIRHRRNSPVHARYMVCTALPLLDPIFARIIGVNFIPFEQAGYLIQYLTFGATDLILLVLIVRDWVEERRHDVFLPALGVVLVTQLPIFFAVESAAWMRFAAWFMSLPLS